MGHRDVHDYSAASPEEPKIFITKGVAWVIGETTERVFQVEVLGEIP
jgi:hypothetical protein